MALWTSVCDRFGCICIRRKKGENKSRERERRDIHVGYSYRVYPRVSHACLIGRLIYRCSFGYWLLRLKGRQKSPRFSLFFWAGGTESLSFSNCRPSFVSFCFLKLDFPKSMQRGGGFFFSIFLFWLCSNKRDWRKKRETEPNKLGDGYRRTPIKKTTTTAWPSGPPL